MHTEHYQRLIGLRGQDSYIDKAVVEMEPEEGGAHPHLSSHSSKHMPLHDGVQIRTCFVVEIRGELTSHTLATEEAQCKNRKYNQQPGVSVFHVLLCVTTYSTIQVYSILPGFAHSTVS